MNFRLTTMIVSIIILSVVTCLIQKYGFMPSDNRILNEIPYTTKSMLLEAWAETHVPTISDGKKNREASNLPTVIQNFSGNITKETFVKNGLIFFNNSSLSNLTLSPWGSENNLTIDEVEHKGLPNWIRMSGRTGNSASGFYVDFPNYPVEYLSLFVGKVNKIGNFQISISIEAESSSGEKYRFLFVNGPLYELGWRGNSYYDSLDSYTSKLVNLPALISNRSGESLTISKILVVMQKQSNLKEFEFGIDLGRTTENAPTVINAGTPAYVIGNVSNYNYTIVLSENVFNNLAIKQIVKLEFPETKFSEIEERGWNILSLSRISESSGNRLLMIADRPIDLSDISVDELSKLNIMRSLSNPSPKDLLLVSVLFIGAIFLALETKVKSSKRVKERS